MKFRTTKNLISVVLFTVLVFAANNTAYSRTGSTTCEPPGPPTCEPPYKHITISPKGGSADATSVAVSKSDLSIYQEDKREYPYPAYPGYVDFPFPYHGDFKPGTRNPFGLHKKRWTSGEAISYAGPDKVFRCLWDDWNKHFKIERCLWGKGERNGEFWLLECLGGDLEELNNILRNYEKIGNPHGNVKDLDKDAYQLAVATGYIAEDKGIDLLLFITSETVVTLANTLNTGGGYTHSEIRDTFAGIFGANFGRIEPKGKAYVWCAAYGRRWGYAEPINLLNAYEPKPLKKVAAKAPEAAKGLAEAEKKVLIERLTEFSNQLGVIKSQVVNLEMTKAVREISDQMDVISSQVGDLQR